MQYFIITYNDGTRGYVLAKSKRAAYKMLRDMGISENKIVSINKD